MSIKPSRTTRCATILISAALFTIGAPPATATPADIQDSANITTSMLVTKSTFKSLKVTISGGHEIGNILTATAKANPSTGTNYQYQWLRNGNEIAGATHSTYQLKTADGGTKISVKVKAKKSNYTTKTVKSAAVSIPKPPDGSWVYPFAWGSTFVQNNGAVKMTIHKPVDVTAQLISAGATPPEEGYLYWMSGITVKNSSDYNDWTVRSYLRFITYDHEWDYDLCDYEIKKAGFEAWHDLRTIRPKSELTRYVCIEAPHDALTGTGKMVVNYLFEPDSDYYHFR